MPRNDRKKAFEEVHRVLKKAGEFHIWDLIIPNRGNNEKEMVGIMIDIKMKEKKISTGYGTFWDKTQTLDDYLRLGKDIGFKRLESKISDNTFYIKFQKT